MPMAVAAGVSAAAGLAGAAMQANAVGSASKAQQQAAALQRSDLQTFRDTGGQATTQAANLLGLGGQDAATAAMQTYQTSPGYQWQLEQGLRAVDAGAAAKGMLRSGATLQAEQKFGQGLANSDFQTYYNNLFGLAKTGEAAAAGTVPTTNAQINAAGQNGANMASIYGDAANTLGASANKLFSNPDFQGWIKGLGSSGGVMQDPSIYGQTAGGAGTGTLQSLGFYTPLPQG